MGLFPQTFIDDLKAQADILRVVGEHVQLRKSGATYKGLCPFHGEKTPSFHVNPDRGFFHCFGCGVGGDVFKFVELQERLTFPEAVRSLAAKFGISVPEPEESKQDPAAQRDREALLKIHEVAAAWFRAELASPAGGRAREALAQREISSGLIERFGYGYAPSSRDALRQHLGSHGFETGLLVRSGLLAEREDGTLVDRFRNRLMIPIARESGPVVAFGGRAMEADQQPKYLNSPETPIYTKGRTLYGLSVTKGDIRRLGYAVLVEGYFDFAQAYQAGVTPVVAVSGTALTPAQAKLLRRFTAKLILSLDPDAAGQGAAARSSELLVAEGFQVNVAMLPEGADPDTFIRQHGSAAYREKLRTSRPYLEYLLDRAAAPVDFTRDEERRAFLDRMLGVAARIPDPAARDQFADRLAHKARITEEVVRAEIRRAAVNRQTSLEGVESARGIRLVGEVRPAEKGLIWALFHDTRAAWEALAGLEPADFDGLAAGDLLRAAREMADWPAETVTESLVARLSTSEVGLVSAVRAQPGPLAPPTECARALRRLRFERERAELQREIDRLQDLGPAHTGRIDALWARKKDLLQQIEALER
ncbi:MAG TPA: DNA primase [Vicinamibacterales bacterium]|nr:DNA primase [Vicinamibacterales bacterium]